MLVHAQRISEQDYNSKSTGTKCSTHRDKHLSVKALMDERHTCQNLHERQSNRAVVASGLYGMHVPDNLYTSPYNRLFREQMCSDRCMHSNHCTDSAIQSFDRSDLVQRY